MQSSLFTEPVEHAHVPAAKSLLDKLPRDLALAAVKPAIRAVRPACSQIVLAGSARREKSHVGDVEFVAIESHPGAILHALHQYCYANGIIPAQFFTKKGTKQIQCQLKLPDRTLQLEIWITTPEHFGWTLYLRTGPLEWNIATLQQLAAHGIRSVSNILHRGNEIFPTPAEQTIFDLIHSPFIHPRNRDKQCGTLYRTLKEAGQTPAFKL